MVRNKSFGLFHLAGGSTATLSQLRRAPQTQQPQYVTYTDGAHCREHQRTQQRVASVYCSLEMTSLFTHCDKRRPAKLGTSLVALRSSIEKLSRLKQLIR